MRTALVRFTARSGASQAILVDVADSAAERAQGLAFRPKIARGMLFLEEGGPGYYTMRNMLVPIDVIVVGTNGHVRFVDKGTPGYVSIFQPPVGMVIELAHGQAKYLGVEPGTKVDLTITSEPPR